MKHAVIVDTGPIIAFLNSQEKQHIWIKMQLELIEPPLLTCEAVISEACYLLRKYKQGEHALFELLRRNLIRLHFSLQKELSIIEKLVFRYSNVPMSLADACLVRMAETIPNSIVLTFDDDFLIYRKQSRQMIPTLKPNA